MQPTDKERLDFLESFTREWDVAHTKTSPVEVFFSTDISQAEDLEDNYFGYLRSCGSFRACVDWLMRREGKA